MSYLQAVSTGDESANTILLRHMLIFKLKQETFGLDIAPIKEIIEFFFPSSTWSWGGLQTIHNIIGGVDETFYAVGDA